MKPIELWSANGLKALVVYLTALVMICLAVLPAEAEQPITRGLEFLGEQPIVLEIAADEAESKITERIVILNPTALEIPLSFSLVMENETGTESRVTVASQQEQPKLGPHAAQAFTLEFAVPADVAKGKISGYLVVAPTNDVSVAPAIVQFLLIPSRMTKSPLGSQAIWVPLVIAVLVIVVAGAVLVWKKGFKVVIGLVVGWMRGTPTWDFSRSWMSVTSLAAVVSNAALLALLPNELESDLVALGAVFGILILVAPVVYLCSLSTGENSGSQRTQQGAEGTSPQGPTPGSVPPHSPAEPPQKGSVLLYLVASALTLWGSFGAINALRILLSQVSDWSSTVGCASWVISALPLLIGLIFFIYATITIYHTIDEQTKPLSARQLMAPTEREPRSTFPLL